MQLIDKFKELGYDPIPQATGFKICCPFHTEQTPSCSVDEANGFFKCFGCGESGSIKLLLSKLGIESFYEVDLLELKKVKLMNKLADALSEFTVYPSNAQPINYKFRNITPETFKNFSAYTLNNTDSIYFPIHFRGKSKGYIEYDVNNGYINHFTSGYIPFNIDKVSSSSIILVEGVFDALSVYQVGYKNVMASLSASYSKSIIKWLKRINAVNLQILYDGDDAGYRGAKNLHVIYPDSTIIKMSEGRDPNDLDNLKEFLQSQGVSK